jgi:hypothetical protein
LLASLLENIVDASNGQVFVIDGSNVATKAWRAIDGESVCSLAALGSTRDAIREENLTENIVVVVDANFRHCVHESEKELANAASTMVSSCSHQPIPLAEETLFFCNLRRSSMP